MIKSLINPISIFYYFLILSAVLFYLNKKNWALKAGLSGIAWMTLVSATPIPKMLLSTLEHRYKPLLNFNDLRQTDQINIVVLGAGHTPDPVYPWNDQLSNGALARLVEGVRIYRELPGSKIVTSGASSIDRESQAEVLARTALMIGVKPEDTIQIRSPHNTIEEAHFYYERFSNSAPTILVTNASHMPRALKIFKKLGLDPTPAPTSYKTKKDPYRTHFPFKPSSSNIAMMNTVIVEYLGILYVSFVAK